MLCRRTYYTEYNNQRANETINFTQEVFLMRLSTSITHLLLPKEDEHEQKENHLTTPNDTTEDECSQ